MKILVPCKRVPNPELKLKLAGGAVELGDTTWQLNPFDEYAVEAALRLTEKSKGGERSGEVVVVSIGPKDTATQLRQALAMGADRGILIAGDDAALDADLVARTLKAVALSEKPDLVLMGKQTVDGDSNAVGQTLAELLGWPMATFAMSLSTNDGGKTLTVGREVDTGVLTVKVTLPAVVTVDLRIVAPTSVKNGATPETHKYNEGARYASLKGIMQAKKKPIDAQKLDGLGIDTGLSTKYVKFELPPARSGSVTFVESAEELVNKLRTEKKAI